MAHQKYQGPYQVKNIGVNGNVYKVVCMFDENTNTYRELDGGRIYLQRTNAYRKARQLNKQWNEYPDNFDAPYLDILPGETEYENQ